MKAEIDQSNPQGSALQDIAALAGGIITGGIAGIGHGIASKFGLTDLDTAMARTAADITKQVTAKVSPVQVAKRIMGGTAVELGEEVVQENQEQVLTNLATGRPWSEGLGTATVDALILALAQSGPVSTVEQTGHYISSREQQAAEQHKSDLDQLVRARTTMIVSQWWQNGVSADEIQTAISKPEIAEQYGINKEAADTFVDSLRRDQEETQGFTKDFEDLLAAAPAAVREGLIKSQQSQAYTAYERATQMRTDARQVIENALQQTQQTQQQVQSPPQSVEALQAVMQQGSAERATAAPVEPARETASQVLQLAAQAARLDAQAAEYIRGDNAKTADPQYTAAVQQAADLRAQAKQLQAQSSPGQEAQASLKEPETSLKTNSGLEQGTTQPQNLSSNQSRLEPEVIQSSINTAAEAPYEAHKERILTSLNDSYGPGVTNLLNSGKLRIETAPVVSTGSEALLAQDSLTAFGKYKNGVITLYTDKISADEAPDILRHELLHLALRKDPEFISLKQDVLQQFEKQKGISSNIRAAFAQVPASTKAKHVSEEAFAYFMQSNPEFSLVKRVVATVKTWLYKHGFDFLNLTEADLYTLAMQAIRAQLAGTETSQSLKQEIYDAANIELMQEPDHSDTENELYSAGSRLSSLKQKGVLRGDEKAFLDSAANWINEYDASSATASEDPLEEVATNFLKVAPDLIVEASITVGSMDRADEISSQRRNGIQSIIAYFKDGANQTLYSRVTAAALVSEALKRNHWFDANTGKAQYSKITPKSTLVSSLFSGAVATRFMYAIVGGEGAKEAYQEAIQKIYSSSSNESVYKAAGVALTGWHKFEQSGSQEDAQRLSGIVAACPARWCTGASTEMAHEQLQDGDFYVYSENGVARIAIRMDEQSGEIGEIRGSLLGQNLTDAEMAKAVEFVRAEDLDPLESVVNSIKIDQKNVQAALAWLDSGGTIEPEFSAAYNNGVYSIPRQHTGFNNEPLLGKREFEFLQLLNKKKPALMQYAEFIGPVSLFKNAEYVFGNVELTELAPNKAYELMIRQISGTFTYTGEVKALLLTQIGGDIRLTKDTKLEAPRLWNSSSLVLQDTPQEFLELQKSDYVQTSVSANFPALEEIKFVGLGGSSVNGPNKSVVISMPRVRAMVSANINAGYEDISFRALELRQVGDFTLSNINSNSALTIDAPNFNEIVGGLFVSTSSAPISIPVKRISRIVLSASSSVDLLAVETTGRLLMDSSKATLANLRRVGEINISSASEVIMPIVDTIGILKIRTHLNTTTVIRANRLPRIGRIKIEGTGGVKFITNDRVYTERDLEVQTDHTVRLPRGAYAPAVSLAQSTVEVERQVAQILNKTKLPAIFRVVATYDKLPEKLKSAVDRNNAKPLNDADGKAAGFVWDSSIYLISDAISADTDVKKLIVHEGAHWLLENDQVFQRKYQGVLLQLKNILQGPKTKDGYSAVYSAYKQALLFNPSASDEVIAEETLAYFLGDSANEQLPWYKEVVSLIKQFIFKYFGVSATTLNLSGYDLAQIVVKRLAAKTAQRNTELQNFIRATDRVRATYVGAHANFESVPDKFLPGARRVILNYDKAQVLSETLTADEVYAKTGWRKAPDGFWRFEVSDHQAYLDPLSAHSKPGSGRGNFEVLRMVQAANNIISMPLPQLLVHPALFAMYPILQEVTVKLVPDPSSKGYGQYAPEENVIYLNVETITRDNERTVFEVLMHEVQHAIQNYEGFTGGASTENFSTALRAPESLVQQVVTKILGQLKRDITAQSRQVNFYTSMFSALTSFGKYSVTNMMDTLNDEYTTGYIDQMNRFMADVDYNYVQLMSSPNAEPISYNEMLRDALATEIQEASAGQVNAQAELQQLQTLQGQQLRFWLHTKDPVTFYNAVFGEVEANDTALRVDMPKEHRKSSPWYSKALRDVSVKEADLVFMPTENTSHTMASEAVKESELSADQRAFLDLALSRETSTTRAWAGRLSDIYNTIEQSADEYTKNAARLFRILDPHGMAFIQQKTDVNNLDLYLRSPEYTFSTDPAALRVFTAGTDESEVRFRIENFMLGDFQELVGKFAVTNKGAYKLAGKYLRDTSVHDNGFKLAKSSQGWHIFSPEGRELMVKQLFTEALTHLIAAEQHDLKARNMSKDAREFVQLFRELMGRVIEQQRTELQRRIHDAFTMGIEEPMERGTSTPLQKIMDGLGEMAGSYFPYIREFKTYLVTMAHPDGRVVEFSTDLSLPMGIVDTDILKNYKRVFNSLTPAGQKVKQYEDQGFVWQSTEPTSHGSGAIFNVPGLLSAMDALLNTTEARMQPMTQEHLAALHSIHEQLTFNIGEIYRSKAPYFSVAERANPALGFEEDPIRAAVSLVRRTAVNMSKRKMAKDMVLALTGRDIAFGEYQRMRIEQGLSATDVDYSEFIKARRIDPVKQQNLHKALREYIQYSLTPDTKWDRVIATLKSAATLKFLAYRVLSPVANLLNLGMAAPATIAAHTGQSLTQSFADIHLALAKLARYRSEQFQGASPHRTMLTKVKDQLAQYAQQAGQATLPEISDEDYAIFLEMEKRGWVEPHFNMDAAQALYDASSSSVHSFMVLGMSAFAAAERVNRGATIMAAYLAHKRKLLANDANPERDLTNEEKDMLLHRAQHTSDRAHGQYGSATKPYIVQKVRALDLFYTFLKFQHNYVLNLAEMGIKYHAWKPMLHMALIPGILVGANASLLAAPVTWLAGMGAAGMLTGASAAGAGVTVLGVASNLPGKKAALVGGTTGVMLLALAMALKAVGGDPDQPEEGLYRQIEKRFGSLANTVTRNGIIGLFGINMKGSIQFQLPLPNKLSEAFGAPGALFEDAWHFAEHTHKGEYLKASEDILPAAAGNFPKAYRLATEGVTTSNYTPMFFGAEPLTATSWEAIRQAFGASPTRIANARETLWHEKRVHASYKKDLDAIYERMRFNELRGENTFSDLKFIEMIDEYNKRVDLSGWRYNVSYINGRSLKRVYNSIYKAPAREQLRELE